jgi:hypothetical protein
MVAIRETSPVGTALPVFAFTVTVAETFSLVPWVMPDVGARVKVVEVGIVEAVAQFVARLFTFTEPNPVAMS